MIRKVLIAPDSYKGTLSAIEVSSIIKHAVRQYLPQAEIVSLPLSDGGEGLVDALIFAAGGRKIKVPAVDPLHRPIEVEYGILPDQTAVVEMAAASGLPLLAADEQNPMLTTSFGTGLVMADALSKGCRKIILGLGGSATNDGGIGAASALGFRFKGDHGDVPPNGAALMAIRQVDLSNLMPALLKTSILIACDVNNPLYGPIGAAAVFGPQKGATPDMVCRLDKGLENLAGILRRDFAFDPQSIAGSGAAGGLAVPFLLLGNTTLRSGLDLVLEQMDFARHLADCDLVVTGEGRTDEQSTMGKVLSGIARRAGEAGRPVIVISGAIESGSEALYQEGITAMFACIRHIDSLEHTLSQARENLAATAADVFRLVAALSIVATPPA